MILALESDIGKPRPAPASVTMRLSDPHVMLTLPTNEGHTMTITVITRLDRKYFLPGHDMVDPYTEDRNGHLYLVSQGKYQTAILCDAIVDIR